MYYRKLFESFYYNFQLYTEINKISEEFLADGAMIQLRDDMPLLLHDFFFRESIGLGSSMQDRVSYAMNTESPYDADLMYCCKYIHEEFLLSTCASFRADTP